MARGRRTGRGPAAVREYVPVGRVTWLAVALIEAFAAALLYRYDGPWELALAMALAAAATAALAFVVMPPGAAYSFATRPPRGPASGDSRRAWAPASARHACNAPVSRLTCAIIGSGAGGLALLAWHLGAPPVITGLGALSAVVYAAAIVLPDRIRRLLFWDINMQ